MSFMRKTAFEASRRGYTRGINPAAAAGSRHVYRDAFERIFLVGAYFLMAITFPLSLFFCMHICKEYERIVVFRLGRLLSTGAKGPGVCFSLPCLDVCRKVDLRSVSFDIPPQELLSRDSVTVSVDAVIYFRIQDPVKSITNVCDAFYSTKLLAQTTIRNVYGSKRLSEMLSEREEIARLMHEALDDAVANWGIKLERIDIKDLRLAPQLMRAMAAEAEATREAGARVICAIGEKKANVALCEAASMLSRSPTSIQLRYLQALSTISNTNNSSIVLPIPIGIFKVLMGRRKSLRPVRNEERAVVDVEKQQ